MFAAVRRIRKSRLFVDERGQTLILAVLALVILLIAVFLLFDLQSIIRIKVKTQSAADAAALAGANWQVESLNLIGEMNLIKACTVLVTDIPPYGDDSAEGITESGNLLTEMQSRVSFVGPLIGFGAAQQAAKNNGMNPIAHWTNFMRSNYVEQLMVDETPETEPDEYYEDWTRYGGHPKAIEGYNWRRPYREMLETVIGGSSGIAARCNMTGALPAVDPPWLLDLELYDAIAAEYWCYYQLRNLLKYYDFSGKWWDVEIVQDAEDFIEESEILPLFVEYSGNMQTFYNAQAFLDDLAAERGLTVSDLYNPDEPEDTDGINSPLPYMSWCIYDSRWLNDAPGEGWVEDSSPLFLRSGMREEYLYGGAVSKMTCQTEPTTISDSYNVNNLKSSRLISGGAERAKRVRSSALAKPLGDLGEGVPPFLSTMILPVFERARLIPISMQDPGENLGYERLYDLARFLEWLADVDDLDNPGSSPPAGTAFFLACLQSLNNEEWRSRGYNRDFVLDELPTTAYDPSSNPTGAGWLQMGYRYTYDEEGNPISIAMTNEDTCDIWRGGGGGSRPGPPILH